MDLKLIVCISIISFLQFQSKNVSKLPNKNPLDIKSSFRITGTSQTIVDVIEGTCLV